LITCKSMYLYIPLHSVPLRLTPLCEASIFILIERIKMLLILVNLVQAEPKIPCHALSMHGPRGVRNAVDP
jgi:hypothetical protein